MCTLQTLMESLTCNLNPCSCPGMPPQTEWSPWTSCSATKSCGGNGVKTRARRVAINQGGSCYLENRTLVKSCHTEACPCPHLPTSWSEWTRCTASCGGGRQRRVREEIWGAGSLCEKHPAEQIKACNTFSCPAKCLWWEFSGGLCWKVSVERFLVVWGRSGGRHLLESLGRPLVGCLCGKGTGWRSLIGVLW